MLLLPQPTVQKNSLLQRHLWLCEQFAQRSCECSVTGSVQSQVGWGFEQPDLVKDVPACGMGVGLDDLQWFLPTQTVL